jgi:hypothetical protein
MQLYRKLQMELCDTHISIYVKNVVTPLLFQGNEILTKNVTTDILFKLIEYRLGFLI